MKAKAKKKTKLKIDETLRTAFRKFMEDWKLNPTKVAQDANLPSPNAIYNFLSGRSASLSLTTLEIIARTYGVSIEVFTGKPIGPVALTIPIRAEIQAGCFRPSFDLPLTQQLEMPFPLAAETIASGAFGAVVRGPGSEALFPQETVLVCMPLPGYQPPLTSGLKMVVQKMNKSGVEVTVRELQMREEGSWLWLRSSHPEFQGAIKYTEVNGYHQWIVGDDTFRVVAVVIGSYRSELQFAAW